MLVCYCQPFPQPSALSVCAAPMLLLILSDWLSEIWAFRTIKGTHLGDFIGCTSLSTFVETHYQNILYTKKQAANHLMSASTSSFRTWCQRKHSNISWFPPLSGQRYRPTLCTGFLHCLLSQTSLDQWHLLSVNQRVCWWTELKKGTSPYPETVCQLLSRWLFHFVQVPIHSFAVLHVSFLFGLPLAT